MKAFANIEINLLIAIKTQKNWGRNEKRTETFLRNLVQCSTYMIEINMQFIPPLLKKKAFRLRLKIKRRFSSFSSLVYGFHFFSSFD